MTIIIEHLEVTEYIGHSKRLSLLFKLSTMENSMNEFSIVVFIIQMAILFSIVGLVYYFMKKKKERLENELNDHPNEAI